MATERLRVILEMVTSDYKKGAKDAERATDGITKSGQEADKALSGVGKRMQSFGPAKAAGIIAAGGAIAVQVGKAVKALDQLGVQAENIRNKFGVVFGDGAEEVEEWADEVNERFGLSQVAVQDLAANFADLLVPIGFTREEATGLTKDALQLANALSEWSGGQIGVAESTDVVRKALLGEREGLKALNVSILQSDVNARVAANGQAGLTGELKAQAEAQATLELITDKSADAIAAYESNTNDALITQKGFEAAILDSRQVLADFVTEEVDSARGGLVLLALVLEDVADELNRGQSGEGSLLKSLLELIPGVKPVVRDLQGLANTYGETRLAQKGLIDGFQRFKILLPSVDFAPLTEAGQSFIETEEDLEESTQDLVDQLVELADETGFTQEGMERLADRGVEALAEAFGISKNEAENLIPILRRVADELDPKVYDGYEERLQALGRGFEDVEDPSGGFAQNVKDIKRDAPLAAAGIRDLTSALAAQTSPVFRFLGALESYDETLKDIDEDGKRTAEESTELLEAFVGLAEASANLDDSDLERFAEVAIEVLDLSRQEAEDLIEQLEILTNRDWAINVVSNLPGTTFDRVSIEAEQAGTPLRAYGGPTAAGRSYIVGERGPEYFTPTMSGRISSSPMSSGSVVFNNVFNVSEATSAKSVVREIREQLSRMDRELA